MPPAGPVEPPRPPSAHPCPAPARPAASRWPRTTTPAAAPGSGTADGESPSLPLCRGAGASSIGEVPTDIGVSRAGMATDTGHRAGCGHMQGQTQKMASTTPSAEPLATPRIEGRIQVIRGLKVMVDADLAALYGVPTKALNQAVKRNGVRFPQDFMFQLTKAEK